MRRHAVGADLLEFARLEEPQQQALHPQGHLADFVEEDGALVGLLELAGLVAVRPGEAALHVAEELRLEQGFGKAGAVDRDERALDRWLCAWTLRHQFLADAALAGDEDLRVRPRDALDLLLQGDHGRACPTSCAKPLLVTCSLPLSRFSTASLAWGPRAMNRPPTL